MLNKANLLLALAVVAPLLFTAGCGTSHKTVVVNPPPGSTVVVPSDNDSHTKVIPPPPPPDDGDY